MIDPISAFLSLIQISAQTEMNRFNSQIRADIARNTLLTTQLTHEHQEKMIRLQEHFRQHDKWVDFEIRKDLMHEQAAIQAHSEKMRQCEEYYKIGNYVQEKLRNKPAPFIIVSTNPHQRYNPFKDEVFSIAPLNRITNTIRQLNSVYEDNKLLTITDTNEFFISESDVAGFYHRELNCPCIIIYANFTGESLAVSAYIAGILDGQRENLSFDNGLINLNPKRELLWDISFATIRKVIEHYKGLESPEMWREYLADFTNNLVALHIQRYCDEYFKYFPLEIYQSQTLNFINSKNEILTKQFPQLLKDCQEKNSVIEEFQRKFSKTRLRFLPSEKLQLNIFGENENKFLTLEIKRFISENNVFSDGFLTTKNTIGKYGFVDKRGITVIPNEYDEVMEMSCSMVAVRKNNNWGLIDSQNNVKLPFEFDLLGSPYKEYSLLAFNIGDRWGLFDLNFNEIFSKRFLDYDFFAYFNCAILLFKNKERIGIPYDFDVDDLNVLSENGYSKYNFYPFEEGDLENFLKTIDVIKPYNSTFPVDEESLIPFKENGLYGFKNSKKKIVFNSMFSEVSTFNNGRCLVKFKKYKSDEWAIIDNQGNILSSIVID